MIDSLIRIRLAAEQVTLAHGRGGSFGLNDAQHDCFRVGLPFHVSSRDPRLDVGSLVDPILAHGSPGSKPYKQLCGLLTTMLKVSAWDCSHAATSESSVVLNYAKASCGAVCEATSAVLASGATTASATAGSPPSTSSKGGSAKAAAIQAQPASDMLPWLVLLGRCCLQWEHHIGVSGSLGCVRQEKRPLEETNELLVQALESAVVDTKVWLAAGSNAAQLEAAGYVVQQLHECIEGAEAAILDAVTESVFGATPNPPSSTSSAASTPRQIRESLSHHLQTLGHTLSSLVHAHACSNPSCSNFSGPSEAKLVAGSSSKCSSCRAARYCGRACQKEHWKHHKPVCKGLAAAVKGASGPVDASKNAASTAASC
jgi:hypothetical protein